MGGDDHNDDLVIDQAFVDKVKKEGGRYLDFYNFLSDEVQQKVRDKHVIDLIDKHFKAEDITDIDLFGCITDATLQHIATKCTRLEALSVERCHQITDDGITAIVEKIGSNLKVLDYSGCNRCTDAALQAVVQHCPNMEYLYADNTGITEIPDSIGHDLPKIGRASCRERVC